MSKTDPMIERLFETLITGDRQASRTLVQAAEKIVGGPSQVLTDLFWPVQQLMDKLYRSDQLEKLNHHMGVRLLRTLADQTAARLQRQASNGRSIFCFCGPSEGEELGAQMAVDLLEAAGFTVFFAGAGIASDEVLARVHEDKPSVLLMFCSAAQDLPEIRGLVDTLREIGAANKTQIAVGGGVFNRAEGLADEIGIDIWATTPMDMVETLLDLPSTPEAAPRSRELQEASIEVTATKPTARARKRKAA